MESREKAQKMITDYLKRNFIFYSEDTSDEGVTRITMRFTGCDQCPGKVTEACIFFFTDCMECRVYYNATGAEWCRQSSRKTDLMYLLNYINAKVFPAVADGIDGELYRTSNLYSPRIYKTEDGLSDITTNTIVPYDFFFIAPLETEDYLTACMPEFLDRLSPAIFLLLLGRITLHEAKHIVDTNFCDK